MIKTLIVEDEAFVSLDLQDTLQRLGHQVLGITVSGEEAIDRVRNEPPDLILMDVSLAGKLNGIETVKQLRASYDMPVVYVTAYSDPATVEPMKDTEPFEYVLKPFNEQVLRVTVELALHKATARKKLIANERLLATTLQSIGDAVITTDPTGAVRYLNPVAEALTGWSVDESKGQPLDRVFPIINEQTRQPAFDPVKAVLETGKTSSLANNTLLISRDGTEYPIEDSAAPIMDDDEHLYGVVLVFRDITKRRQSDQWLRQAQKLDSLGLLAGGIAHDFNNILATIISNTTMLSQKQTDPLQSARIVERIQRASEHAAALTSQLLSYAGGRPLKSEILDLNDVVTSLLVFISSSLPDGVVIEKDLSNDPLLVLTERSQLQQVLLNLVLNGFDAMRDNGGTLSLQSRQQMMVQDSLDTYVSKTPLSSGAYVQLSITDTGIGMTPAVMERMFDPFFTTKPTGNGLGLAATLGIIYQCNGGIKVESSIGNGSSFTIIFPYQGETIHTPQLVPTDRQPLHRHPEASKCILIADDQADILETLDEILRTEGYETLLAVNGQQAIEQYRAHAERITLVMMDIRMPVVNGVDALIILHSENPNLQAVLMTGHVESHTINLYEAKLKDTPILRKPFTYEEILEFIHQSMS